ncbi:uncharacterized protein VICG_00521 [Vittaforma corneae ATCC 50505]|uniref:Uncharacterized protein n=1 Tax=Vittaforma corneae (strain ATCC 50505) TaxID=993615 RepID=L2GQ18_VITCO|nr:uncharacterized protein VICG_00521 [Vittaforma corneae ATCC 50505]ELA42422.1 hypothetical protein VICG_00521 [Vittaforma corneae ATCC 50505]
MAYEEVKNILEYKNVNDIDYIYVEWEDNTTTWEKMSNLSCRELICGFFKESIKTIQKNERAKEEESRKKREESLLQKMINRNIDEATKAARIQNEILTSLVNNSSSNPLLKGLKIVQPIHQDFLTAESFAQPLPNPSFQSPLRNAFSKLDAKKASVDPPPNTAFVESETKSAKIKSQRLAVLKNNNITVKLENNACVNIMFYYRNDLPSLIFDTKDTVTVYHKSIATYLHSLYLSQSKAFHMFPSADIDDAPESPLEMNMKVKGLSLVCKLRDSFWIISVRNTLGKFFNIYLKSKFVIFNVSKSAYLERLFQLKDTIQQDSLWLENSFKFGLSTLTDKICKNFDVSSLKQFFILGDVKSVFILHLNKIVQRVGQVVSSIQDASTVLIQESYLKFLHFVPGFYGSLKNDTKFFIVKPDGLEEILPSGGMVTFTDEYIEKAELLAVADFVKKILTRQNWEIKIRRSTYLALKRRLNLQAIAMEHTNSIKTIYKAFKANICDSCDRNLRDHLEMSYFRTHRHFIEIAPIRTDNATIPIDEATKLIGTG